MSAPISQIFYDSHTNFRPIETGKAKRVIVELFLKIVCNFWRTLGSYFGKVSYEGQSDRSTIVRELEHKRTIGPSTITEYSGAVLGKNKNFELVSNFLFNICDSNLPNSEKKMVFIPVVLQSGLRDHVVAVVYDWMANRIELFDPKGFVPLDRSEKVRNSDDLRLIDVLAKVVETYGTAKTELWENTAKHQRDSHNCGVYVLDYIERRLNGEQPQDIASKGLTFREANNSKRKQFIENYLHHSFSL